MTRAKADLYCCEVVTAMLALRGWHDAPYHRAPPTVVGDVFDCLDRYTDIYERGLRDGTPAKEIASAIQNLIWDEVRE